MYRNAFSTKAITCRSSAGLSRASSVLNCNSTPAATARVLIFPPVQWPLTVPKLNTKKMLEDMIVDWLKILPSHRH